MITKVHPYYFLFLVGVCLSCEKIDKHSPLFEKMSLDSTGVDFSNDLTFDQEFNIYTYRNFYNGGGVGLADFNNDGLVDIYFTGNQVSNRLYLNKGDFRFEDITKSAGVAGSRSWSTGVSLADVNGDGLIDIYVCNSGDVKGDDKQNELFINNGDLTFTDRAEEYNVADKGFTTHAVFFDYDNDNDLDLYILNNSYQSIGSFNLRKNERPKRDVLGGDKLMRNDGNHFTDVSEEAGIYGSIIGFGLGVTVGDINKDGWQDIFVSNDFFERDYLYINNADGTFKECLPQKMKSISGASMGADLADINNDGNPDLFVTEMLPKDNSRIKTVTTFENWDRYQYSLENDYYHQFTRNMLQINNGKSGFSEVGRLAGVEATDWSWGALMFDMDNDGLRDIFVANGIYQDLTNQDYLQYVSNEEVVKSIVSGNKVDYKKLVELIPSNPISNFAFQNKGNLTFVDQSKLWGLAEPGFSNGSAYGDLDNDGDLDLVLSNVNGLSSVYRNNSNKQISKNHFLKFQLTGTGANTAAFGTKITISNGDKKFYLEQMPIRGFESSMDPRPNIGLGSLEAVEQILVQWPDGKTTIIKNQKTNTVLNLNQNDGIVGDSSLRQTQREAPATFFDEVQLKGLDFRHKENLFVDFDREALIYNMLSTEGPRINVGDLNGDKLDDLFVGGAKDQAGSVYFQLKDGTFVKGNNSVFVEDKISEDVGSAFFDADNDGDLDLYVCSGGNEFPNISTALIDRLYLNDGKGNFTKSKQILPTANFESTSVVWPFDYDKDGDMDLFVGTRLQPFGYGKPCNGYILNNDGKGNFTSVTKDIAPELLDMGMITDAIWSDIDNDQDIDLLIVGEYMPIKVLINTDGKFSDATKRAGLDKSNGWWNVIRGADFDNDGDMDFVVGNHGLNSRFKASSDKPLCMFVNDFDQNGTVEQIICQYNGDTSYPLVLRHDLVKQLPALKKKYLKYENYKNETVADIFTKEQLESSIKLDVYELATGLLVNNGNGTFSFKTLPIEAQFSPTYAIEIADFDSDGNLDIVLGGNFYGSKPEMGRYDASTGLLLKGNGDCTFVPVKGEQSGINIDGEVRDMSVLKTATGSILVVARNNDSILAYKIKSSK
ncbi:MAG: VCBS repeat-containing protein [Cyclobacteriaceae bacterium]|jgi:enediyne biosynthesis protein E4|nr:VCBS repeat-containing protein [Cyclobacteriaceae bacterium]